MVTATATFAFDKKSARSFDADGRMRVRDCVISVAEINPYFGREIPGRDKMRMAAGAVYDLYRDPAELERAAPTFEGLPLMIRHVAQTADEPRKEYIGGSVTNVRFKAGKLIADLLVWDKQAIDYIESGELADLSSSYRYKYKPEPGEVNGRKYHGRMTEIEGNHVALVEDGRATGAHVADSALSSQPGASTVENDTPNAPDTGGNAGAAQALLLITQKLEAIETRLAAVEGGKVPTPQSEAEVGIPASVNTAANDEQSEKDRKDESDGEKRSDKDRKDEREGEERAMDANAVQAVVKAAVELERKRANAVTTAKQACRQDLGDMIAMDDAGEIYRAALKQRGVDISAIPAGAEQATYQAIQSVSRPQPSYANDSRTGDAPAFDTKRIRNLGRA